MLDSIECKVLKLILNWIAKILKIGEERLPKALLLELFVIDSDYELAIERYNWVTFIKKTFFQPFGEMGFFESLQLENATRNY